MLVAGSGLGVLHSESGQLIRLQRVLHVPTAAENLLSVGQLAEDGFSAVFSDSGSCTLHMGNIVVAEATSNRNLYHIRATPQWPKVNAALVVSADVWHKRLGHISDERLTQLKGMVSGMEVGAERTGVCEGCQLGKQRRSNYSRSDSRSDKPMQLVHMDLMGPVVESRDGFRYLLGVLDDYSRLSAVVPVKLKSDVPAAVRHTLKQMEKLSSSPVVTVRSDRGGEFIAEQLSSWFKEQGVMHQHTAPYTPQQNGRAERLNNTLQNSARSMLHDAGLQDELWADAMCTASYVRNRSPVTGLDKTPWEAFTGRRPDVSHLRVWGCKAFVHVPKQHRQKLDPVSEVGTLIGYEPGSKAYRILVDSRVVVSNDVTFDEAKVVPQVRSDQGDGQFVEEMVYLGPVPQAAGGNVQAPPPAAQDPVGAQEPVGAGDQLGREAGEPPPQAGEQHPRYNLLDLRRLTWSA